MRMREESNRPADPAAAKKIMAARCDELLAFAKPLDTAAAATAEMGGRTR